MMTRKVARKFPAQSDEIQALLKACDLTEQELAAAAGVKPDTMRKIAGGYEKASSNLMLSIRNACALHQMRRSQAASVVYPAIGAAVQKLRETAAQLNEICATLEGKHPPDQTDEPVNYAKIQQVADDLERIVASEDEDDGADQSPTVPRRFRRGSKPSAS